MSVFTWGYVNSSLISMKGIILKKIEPDSDICGYIGNQINKSKKLQYVCKGYAHPKYF